MYIIRCCKCGKLHRLDSINDLNNGATYTKQGKIWGMTTSRIIKGKIIEYNDMKKLLVCCDKCIDKWHLFYNGVKDWHEDFFNRWLKDKYTIPKPFVFR
jgi:hypothetical protein